MRTTLLNKFLLNMNFEKLTIRLHFFLIFSMVHVCKISRKLNINSHVINQIFKFHVFVVFVSPKKKKKFVV